MVKLIKSGPQAQCVREVLTALQEKNNTVETDLLQ